jgi:hypothetical protein
VTTPRVAVGASAQPTARLSSQRGTEPYSANTIASTTVDLPAPVDPTSAKKSASVKSTVDGCRNEPKPSSSSLTGRI